MNTKLVQSLLTEACTPQLTRNLMATSPAIKYPMQQVSATLSTLAAVGLIAFETGLRGRTWTTTLAGSVWLTTTKRAERTKGGAA